MRTLRSTPYKPYKVAGKAQFAKKRHSWIKRIAFLVVGVLLIAGIFTALTHTKKVYTNVSSNSVSTKQQSSKQPTPAAKPNVCANNSLAQLILVSISQRHMWACSGTTQVYDSAVITGMENLPADLTPTGTYHIYAKETDVYLKGSDSTGSWDDYVYYWMPFLYNQYGTYGFHDATWRAPNDFGAISPYSSNASHGCVEMPLSTAKWLYGWAEIGTTVTINA